ncbi:MAG: restriction endonuclease subunit S [Desulfobacterales bacterium]|nr:restriction endonuclease subunit S [Desulfobacterales bacterium]
MEVREGYKKTEVGVIPEDWEVKKLNTICDVRDGTHESPKYLDDGVTFITSKNIINGKIDFSDVTLISKNDAININKRSKVNKGDILMSMIGTIGNSVLIDFEPDFCIKNVALFKPQKVLGRFFIQLLYSLFYQTYINSKLDGGIQKFISLGVMREFDVPLPSTKAEQTAIATALSDADALIQSLEKLIAKKRLIKQGAMQELLKPKEGWVVKKLGEVGEIVTGATPPTLVKEYWTGDIPWITPTDISAKKDISKSEREITKLGLTVIRKLPANTLLVTCIASIGKNSILRKEGACNQQINALIPNDNNDVEFFYYLIENNKQYLLSKAGITATNIISKKGFAEITFSIPSLPEQTRIATILSDMDAEISALETKLAKYKQVKQGMMQELLTGKIRLV